tara:strand:+ start:1539 stop:1790 length:252 start_codon:yes stop_codon:yes gene_type:complete
MERKRQENIASSQMAHEIEHTLDKSHGDMKSKLALSKNIDSVIENFHKNFPHLTKKDYDNAKGLVSDMACSTLDQTLFESNVF